VDFPEKSVTVARTLKVPSKSPVKLMRATKVVLRGNCGDCWVIAKDFFTSPDWESTSKRPDVQQPASSVTRNETPTYPYHWVVPDAGEIAVITGASTSAATA
jgi:hypothetical protein